MSFFKTFLEDIKDIYMLNMDYFLSRHVKSPLTFCELFVKWALN